MSHLITTVPEWGYLTTELACYLQTDVIAVPLAGMHTLEHQYNAQYIARQYAYQLPLGKLSLLEITLYLPFNTASVDIETIRMIVVKSALAWYKASCSQNEDQVGYDALIFDIQLVGGDNNSEKQNMPQRLQHSFGARYFLEDLVVDMSESRQQLQVFSWNDWYTIAAAVQTPCELWRFLAYHLAQLQHSATSHAPSFETEEALLAEFLHSPELFASAIAVDNALIKNNTQDQPNAALVAMTLAYQNKSKTAQMYHQHMGQAARLWSQLSMQMITMHDEKQADDEKLSKTSLAQWQQQLLDESLFSRHELIRTLYQHPKQNTTLQKEGYVVHQHSYESLGRHYVLVFYGQSEEGKNSKAVVQPNLAKIAQDVATRLPMRGLHHIIVLGIEFVVENKETFIDLDLWIQPVNEMTQRERQLTKQVQRLKIQKSHQPAAARPQRSNTEDNQPKPLPSLQLSLTIPARKDKP